MEESIDLLDENTDPATKQMLKNVVKKKKKFDTYKFAHNLSITMTLAITGWFLMYLYHFISIRSGSSFLDVFAYFLSQDKNLFVFLLLLGSFFGMNILKTQRDKFDKEFHGLRCEIVDRSKDLWKKEEEWKSRHIVFELMKKKYDINLYHEQK
ncbi:DUF2663 family protein [Pseudoneobacillus sp. C159]